MLNDYKQLVFNTTSPSIHKNLLNEFGISEKDVKSGVKHIMDWYEQQSHLPKFLLDFNFIETVYALNKYSIEKSKQKMDTLITIRSKMPEFFINRDTTRKDYKEDREYVENFIVPELTSDGMRVLCYRFSEKDPKNYNPEAGYRHLFMIADMRMFCETSSGDHYVWDFTNIKFGHITKLTPTMLKKTGFIIQEAYSTRIKSINFINAPKFAQTLFSILKGVMKKKIVQRMYFHDSLESLHKFISPEYLPKEYGGTKWTRKELIDNLEEAVQSEFWTKWFFKSCVQIIDESKRVNNISNSFGISGSFKKLELD